MYTVIQRGPLGRRIRTVECDTLGRANELAADWTTDGTPYVSVVPFVKGSRLDKSHERFRVKGHTALGF